MHRFVIFGLACGAVLYACLSPSEALPGVSLWDKAQHAIAWGALTGLGLMLWPRRALAVAATTLMLGVAVEVLQATMDLGRTGDVRDLAADAVGVAASVALAALFRRGRGRARQG